MQEETAYKIRVKPVTTPPKTPETPQGRDTFETPNYAVDLLIPFIPRQLDNQETVVWECAAGSGKIANRLIENGFHVFQTDIRQYENLNETFNFITDGYIWDRFYLGNFCIITNPPFSIKDKFIEKAFSYKVPFAFLINADYHAKHIEWVQRGCEKIIPNRRIAYITPNIIQRVHEGEVWKAMQKESPIKMSMEEYKDKLPDGWKSWLMAFKDLHNYASKDEIPQNLLFKYSSAQFHSMWLTYGFNLGRTETFVDLPIKELKENI